MASCLIGQQYIFSFDCESFHFRKQSVCETAGLMCCMFYFDQSKTRKSFLVTKEAETQLESGGSESNKRLSNSIQTQMRRSRQSKNNTMFLENIVFYFGNIMHFMMYT